jgi:hypothetical protein
MSYALAAEQEDLLLEVLLDPLLSQKRFQDVVNKSTKNFPAPKTLERRQLTNRRGYLLRSPDSLRAAEDAYRQRRQNTVVAAAVAAAAPPPQEQEEEALLGPEPRLLDFEQKMGDEYDLEIPLSWDARYNPGSVSVSKG